LYTVQFPVINAVVQDTTNVNDVVFPVAKEHFTLEPQFGTPMANIRIPAELLKERAGSSSKISLHTDKPHTEMTHESLFRCK